MTQSQLVDQDELLEKIDALDIDPQEKFNLKKFCVEEYAKLKEEKAESKDQLDDDKKQERDEILSQIIKENDLDFESDNIGMTSTPKSNNLDINGNDLIELEILASELDEENDLEQEDEEWDFEFDDDEEEEDEDYADELLYGNAKTNFMPLSRDGLNDKLWTQVSELRKKKESDGKPTKEIFKSILKPMERVKEEKKKSVRFNDTLDIQQVANISEELKQMAQYNQSFSRFKQERNYQRQTNEPITIEEEEDFEEPLSEFIIEKNVEPEEEDDQVGEDEYYDSDSFSLEVEEAANFTSFEESSSEFIEDENRISEPKYANKILVKDEYEKEDEFINRQKLMEESIRENEDMPKKVSKFKAMRGKKGVSDVEKDDNVVSDIVEKDDSVSDVIEREFNDNVVSDVVEKDDHVVSDIGEPMGENEDMPKKVSKFKAMRGKKGVSDVEKDDNVVSDIVEKDDSVSDVIEREFNDNVVSDVVEKDDHVVSDIGEPMGENEDMPKKVSKFKAMRGKKGVSDVEKDDNVVGDIVEKDVASDIVEKDVNDIVEKNIVNDIVEKDVNDIVEKDVIVDVIERDNDNVNVNDVGNEKKVSRFKSMRQAKPNKTKSQPKSQDTKSQPKGQDTKSQPKGQDTKSQPKGQDTKSQPKSQDLNEVLVDYGGIEDMDTMARAYVLGAYDDDIMTEGPVVDKVEDFEVLNKMINSFQQEEEDEETKKRRVEQRKKQLKLKNMNQYDEKLDVIGGEYSEEEEEGDEIMTDDIIERETNHVNSNIEDEILGQEIKDNYNRMRQKMIFERGGYLKNEQEQEFEYDQSPVVDEQGNPVRVSRFKSKRLGL
ncbi:hypothetical protein QCA50_017170 [Cerrena zonata]|uniref:DUF3835 domain-containing protein n=1 Tax=Cerrena zonata TaxID=2478898 RepID=A0AAW0FFU7_9APHY